MNEDEGKRYDYMKWLGYAWTVIVNLITVFVVLAIYGKVYESFEIITVSLLILTYLNIQGFLIVYGKTTSDVAFALDAQFEQIRRLLKDERSDYEVEELKNAKNKIGRATVKLYINVIFMSIIYIIALAHLIGEL